MMDDECLEFEKNIMRLIETQCPDDEHMLCMASHLLHPDNKKQLLKIMNMQLHFGKDGTVTSKNSCESD